MLSIRYGLVAAIAALPSFAAAQLPAGWTPFTKTFQAYVDSDRVVGASVVYMQNGRLLGRYETGMQDRAANAKVDSQTIYHWGSITKSLTAIAIVQLRDRGKLSLDDKLVRWVPELKAMHDPYGMMDSITLRMVLSHTAGFQNGTWPYGNGKPWEPFEPTTWNQLVAMMPYQELLFKPGSRYSYSNPGFIYLARVIEQITGDPWDAYVQKNIFAPLGLDRSYFRATPYFLASHRSHNYNVRRDSATSVVQIVDNGAEFDPGITSPNGAWNAPVSDLVKYTAFLSGATPRDVVLSRASLEEMWKPGKPMSQSYESAPKQWMGLSFFVLDRNGHKLLGHTGSQAGFRSFYYFDPITKAGVIAVFNTTNDVAPASAAQRRMNDAALQLLAPSGVEQASAMKPEDTEVWDPVPAIITPGATDAAPPSDAVVLFDGRNLDQWVSAQDGSPARWSVSNGVATVVKSSGDIRTKRSFNNYQLHIEWRIPTDISGSGQARGNSGVFLASTTNGGYELQVVDSYNNATYVNGQAASIYKQYPPLVNAMRKPGEWQTYDVIWTAPRFNADGSLESPAYVTAFHNGVLVQNHVALSGVTKYIGFPDYDTAHGAAPILLQAHGDPSPPISFRNIWVRELK